MHRTSSTIFSVLYLTALLICPLAFAQEQPATTAPAEAAAPATPVEATTPEAPAPVQAAPAVVPAAPVAVAAPNAPLVKSMKLICDGKVKSNGATSIIFTPEGGATKEMQVTIQEGMKDREVCRDISKELSVALGGMPYKVKYKGTKIKIKAQKDAKFSLSLGSQTALGLTIALK